MSLTQLLLFLMFHKSHNCVYPTTVKMSTDFVIQSPLSQLRRQGNYGPKRGPEYNPNFGYEPYWPGGGWVFNGFEIPNKGKPNTACGKECHEMYRGYGKLCGRNKYYNYKTFTNYCALLNEDCRGRHKWMIAYTGQCGPQLIVYPIQQSRVMARAKAYLPKFNSLNPSK